MPFISTPERVGERAGMLMIIETILRCRFGDEGLTLLKEIHDLYDADKYLAIAEVLAKTTTLDEVRRALADVAAPKKKRAPRKPRKS